MNQTSTAGSAERGISPTVVRSSKEAIRSASSSPHEGAIALLWAQSAKAHLLDDFERAVASNDRDLALDVRDRLADVSEGAQRSSSKTTRVAELTYHDRSLIDELNLTDGDPFGVALVPYDGSELDESQFRVHERTVDGTFDAGSYEYRIIVAPPAMSEVEIDAGEAVPPGVDEAAIATGPQLTTTLALVFAAGVVVGAAAAGSGSADPAVHELSSTPSDGSPSEASVDDLIAMRSELTG